MSKSGDGRQFVWFMRIQRRFLSV